MKKDIKKNVIKKGSTQLKVKIINENMKEQFGEEIYLIKNEWNEWIGKDLKNKSYNFLLPNIRNINIMEILECK